MVEKRPYSVDGIEEYDHPLPRWWLYLFYLTIIFSPCYLIYLHVWEGPSLIGAYNEGYQGDAQLNVVPTDGPSLEERMSDPTLIAAGKVPFATNCMPCHGAEGQGTVGPNLTDRFWIHGSAPNEILKTIVEGVTTKGMPAWGNILGLKTSEALTAYVWSMQGSNPPNPKAPQGVEQK